MSFHPESTIKRAANRLGKARVVTALTGSGISVGSGIRPFRGKGGLWEKYDPEVVVNIDNFRRAPAESWVMLREIVGEIDAAIPNPAHHALTQLQKMGPVSCIITQNVDGLHQKAGSRDVIEFHGSVSRVVCLDCSALYLLSDVDLDVLPPVCFKCGGLLKPDAIFFGEPIPPAALLRAHVESQRSDIMLVIGTSGMVEPAAGLPALAKSNGALIIEINPQPSWLTGRVVDIFLQGNAEKILPLLVSELEGKWNPTSD